MGLIIFFIAKPFFENIQDLSKKIQEGKANLDILEKKEKDKSNLLKDFKDSQKKIQEVEKSITSYENVVNFIVELEKIAYETHLDQKLKMSEVEDKKEEAGRSENNLKEGSKVEIPKKETTPSRDFMEKSFPGFKKLEYKVSLTGDFLDVANYLYYLEKMQYYTIYKKVDIRQTEKDSETGDEFPKGHVEATCEILLFVVE